MGMAHMWIGLRRLLGLLLVGVGFDGFMISRALCFYLVSYPWVEVSLRWFDHVLYVYLLDRVVPVAYHLVHDSVDRRILIPVTLTV
ncbi:hypothetical protein BJX96DRAFT_59827 [Aspergillus floccosus]